MTETKHGGCLCGAIRYRIEGEPVRTSLCYCTQCRRQTGSAMPAFAVFRASELTIDRGTPATFRSSARAVRQFCPTCGSALFWREDAGGVVDVFLGSFDKPELLPTPVRQIWTVHRLPWVSAVDAIPAHREAP
jgi:hypothetical protein